MRVSRPDFPIFSPSRTMHTTPPRPPCAVSPTSNSRWKRGRPVSSWGGFARSIQQESDLCDKTAQARQGQDAEAEAAVGIQRLQLWDSSKPIHFAPTTCKDLSPTPVTESVSRADEQAEVNIEGPGHSSMDSQLKANRTGQHMEGDRQGGEADQYADWDTLSDSESTATGESAMENSTDSDYVVDHDHENISDQESDTDAVEQENDTATETEDEFEEHVPLSYQIPKEVLRTAMEAAPNTRGSYWSTKFYRGPQQETILVHYCKSMDVADRVAKYFMEEKVVGFDIEWKPLLYRRSVKQSAPSIKESASLIQLACEDRIALFHIALFSGTNAEDLMPPNLKTVLESPDIIKVGVAVKSDFTRLQTFLGIQARGVFELSRLHNLVTWYKSNPSKVTKKLASLALQVHEHLQLPLYKGTPLDDEPDVTSSVRASDWSQPLSLDQIHYAADDAYAGFRLYDVLEQKRKKLRPIPSAIEVCDDDPKLAPKSGEHREKKTRVPNPKVEAKVEAEQDFTTEDQDSEEMEEPEDTDGYDTAPEELVDSLQLEEIRAYAKTQSQTEDTQEVDHPHKRVGRVKFSWLREPDPGYPNLPQISNEKLGVSSSPETHIPLDIPDRSALDEDACIELFEHDADSESDEFADPELEETLKTMNFDSEGKLMIDSDGSTVDVDSNSEGRLNAVSPSAEESDQIMVDHVPDNTPSTPAFRPLVDPTSDADHSSKYIVATTWAQEYLQSTVPSPKSTAPSRIRATIPHLRAYHMSIHQKLSLNEIAQHLRDPPLSLNTVAGYILQAISLERLEYDKGQLKTVMMVMPSNLRQGRWKWLAENVGILH